MTRMKRWYVETGDINKAVHATDPRSAAILAILKSRGCLMGEIVGVRDAESAPKGSGSFQYFLTAKLLDSIGCSREETKK